MKKARKFQKNINLYFTNYTKAFNSVGHNKLWKILKGMGMPGHLTCLLRNLYAGQETTVWTLNGTTDWFLFEKGVRQGCCHPVYLTEHIMKNVRLDELQGEIKIGRRKKKKKDRREKHQQPQVCGWYHSHGRKQRGAKEPLDEVEGGEWKNWLKTKY